MMWLRKILMKWSWQLSSDCQNSFPTNILFCVCCPMVLNFLFFSFRQLLSLEATGVLQFFEIFFQPQCRYLLNIVFFGYDGWRVKVFCEWINLSSPLQQTDTCTDVILSCIVTVTNPKIIIYIWDSAFSKLCGNPGEATCLCQRSTKLAVSPHQRSSKLVPNSPAKVPKAKPHPHSLQTPQKSTLVNFIWFTDHIKYWNEVNFVSC